MSATLSDPAAVDWSNQPGLYVSVYRLALDIPTLADGISHRCGHTTVNGVIDAETRSRPVLHPIPPNCRSGVPNPDAPAMWIYQGFDQVFLVPATHLVDSVPDLIGLRHGGNFAYRDDPRFYQLVGFDAAIKIHDHREF
ncbi:hypothetical protein [Nocardia sp. NRRL S-836]|uniref:hypothetical protein n=1 Tax=Nocardia sp. NRRL S-836 TaxID=1519492 RepID=UPI0006ADD486|nr:hypothetical protein [Nocardia sp. NRRL S-836]KOV84721.1 hypothetical protein ADL03_15750 [Nocardia sp. NRRL S-836]